MRAAIVVALATLWTGCPSRPRPTLALSTVSAASLRDDVTFQNAFTLEPQCKGISLLIQGQDKADFVVTFDYTENKWVWILSYPHDPVPEDAKHMHGAGGMGYQEKSEDAVRDVCLTIWDDVHQPYPVNPGGTVR